MLETADNGTLMEPIMSCGEVPERLTSLTVPVLETVEATLEPSLVPSRPMRPDWPLSLC